MTVVEVEAVNFLTSKIFQGVVLAKLAELGERRECSNVGSH